MALQMAWTLAQDQGLSERRSHASSIRQLSECSLRATPRSRRARGAVARSQGSAWSTTCTNRGKQEPREQQHDADHPRPDAAAQLIAQNERIATSPSTAQL